MANLTFHQVCRPPSPMVVLLSPVGGFRWRREGVVWPGEHLVAGLRVLPT